MELVERLKKDREFRDVKVSPLLLVAKALMLAVRRNPDINASWDEAAQEIVVKHYVNLGIAAATPRGLVVPNVKDADRMSLRELAEALQGLTATAREGRTQPADMAGGTMTITNVGVFGVDARHADPQPGRGRDPVLRRDPRHAVGPRRRDRGPQGHPARAVVRPPDGRRRSSARCSSPTSPASSRTRPPPSSGSRSAPGVDHVKHAGGRDSMRARVAKRPYA